jgi:hypothetical protein
VPPERSSQINIRVTPEEKKELERRAALAEKELQKTMPRAKLGVGPWMLNVCLGEAGAPDKRKGGKP